MSGMPRLLVGVLERSFNRLNGAVTWYYERRTIIRAKTYWRDRGVMIVRAVLDGPVEPFDVFNDYRDTFYWLSSLPKSAKRDRAMQWLAKIPDASLIRKHITLRKRRQSSMIKTISFDGRMWDCRARDLWQGLFDFYRCCGGSLDHMDNLLIDFKNCMGAMDRVADGSMVKFLWGAYLNCGFTYWVDEDKWINSDPVMTNTGCGYDIYVIVELSKDQAVLECESENDL